MTRADSQSWKKEIPKTRALHKSIRRTAIQLFGKSAKPLTALLGGPGAAALKAGVKTWAGRVPWVGGIITAAIG